MAFTLCGLWLAYRYNLTSGAAIILVAGVGFFLTVALDQLGIRRGSRRRSADGPNME
jgi:zinc transport system permease protein